MNFPSILTILLGLMHLSLAELFTVPIIQTITPASKECPVNNTDCRTATQAAPYITRSMYEYGIFNVKEMAAVISLMAFESADFKYKRNISPGRPGQGTAYMQMAKYNLLYAKQIDYFGPWLKGVHTTDGFSKKELNDILSLVTPDTYNFGSGPWFLVTQCSESVREKPGDNIDARFVAYMECIGVDVTEERLVYLRRAKEAFNVKY
ncbi:Fc.00g082080.m01.CDS01 [Cosmosporella sp. VM-42]